MNEERGRGMLGLRAQIALALLGVLAITATLAAVAIRPLASASARGQRRHAGLILSRAVAGQVALLPRGTDLAPLLSDAVGPDALGAAAVLDAEGHVLARAGRFHHPLPARPFLDSTEIRGDELTVTVVVPTRGAFVSEVPLGETAGERSLFVAVLLYSAVAAAASLWVVFVLLTRYTVRPVEELTRAAERVAAGRRDTVIPPRGAREVVRAARAFNAMTAELGARERELSARVEELERTARELRAAQDQLVRSERLAVVGRLAAGIAHEVGNPLAAIVGLTDVMKDGGLSDAEVKDFAARVGLEAERIHRTIRELLDYARTAPAPEEAGAGDVAEAVSQVIRLLEPQKSMRDVELTTSIAKGLPRVRLATDRIVQVLLNLALNAADASAGARPPSGKSRISVRAATIDGQVTIEVEDDGPGIPDELRSRIFEPFFTTKPAGQGTGLGLAICAVLVEQVGGSIAALSRADGARGALIVVRLPVHSST